MGVAFGTAARRGAAPSFRCLACFVLLAVAIPGPGARGQDLAQEPIDITAQEVTYEQERGIYEASGDVRIEQPNGRSLTADWITINENTQMGVAVGNVVIRDGDDVVRADFAAVNIASLEAVATQASLDSGVGLKVTGAAVERRADGVYRVEDGTFTACGCPPGEEPLPWQVDIGSADVEVGGYAVARDVQFRVLDFPLVYVPWLILPVKTERQTGFMVPTVGTSTRSGAKFELPFFWAARHNINVLARPMWIAKRGFKYGAEVEYLLGEEGSGSGGLAYLPGDREVEDNNSLNFSEDRAAYWFQIEQPLAYRSFFGADVARVSDNNYPLDFDDLDSFVRNSRTLPSSLFLTNAQRGLFGMVKAATYDDLQSPDGLDRDKLLLRQLPDVHLDTVPRPLGALPFYGGLDVRYTHFDQPYDRQFFGPLATPAVNGQFFDTGLDARFDDAEEPNIPGNHHFDNFGVNVGGTELDGLFQEGEPKADFGHRVDLAPTLSLPWRLGPIETLSEGGYRATFYDPEFGDSEARALWTGRLDARVRLIRELLLGGRTLNHIVEPKLSFAYVSNDDQKGNPLFIPEHAVRRFRIINHDLRVLTRNPSDRIEEEKLMIAAVANRFYAPGAAAGLGPRLVGNLRLGGGYDFEQSQVSPFYVDADFQPNENLSFESLLGYDFKESRTVEALVDLRWRTGRLFTLPSSMSDRRHELSVGYRYLRDLPRVFEDYINTDDVFDDFDDIDRINQLNLAGNIALHRQLDVFGEGFLLLNDTSAAGGTAGVALLSTCACWELIVSFQRRIRPSNTRFQFEIRLAGLGFQPLTTRTELRSRSLSHRSVDGSDPLWEPPAP